MTLELNGRVNENDPPLLEERCWTCAGSGYDGECERCDGTGRMLTSYGKTIVEVVVRHLRIKPVID